MRVAHSLASILRARLILGVDLEANSRAVAAAEANAMVGQIGRSYIDALELGNEPELYGSFGWYRSPAGAQVLGRPRGYDIPAYTGDFSALVAACPPCHWLAPAAAGPCGWRGLGYFLRPSRGCELVTVHAYPLKHCTKATIVTSRNCCWPSRPRTDWPSRGAVLAAARTTCRCGSMR